MSRYTTLGIPQMVQCAGNLELNSGQNINFINFDSQTSAFNIASYDKGNINLYAGASSDNLGGSVYLNSGFTNTGTTGVVDINGNYLYNGYTDIIYVQSMAVGTWSFLPSSNNANQWFGVCWSPKLMIFCAVANAGTNRVMISSNGINWTGYAAADETAGWTRICWSPELEIFCTVAASGTARVMTSSNGTTWITRTSNVSNTWCDVCWSSELGIFCAVANAGTNTVMTSPDGITWTTRNSTNDAISWRAICWSPQLGLFCATGFNSPHQVMLSNDGILWMSANSADETNSWFGVCWSPELSIFCAVGGSFNPVIMVSTSGFSWTAINISGGDVYTGVCWSPQLGLFCASPFRSDVSPFPRILVSSNGINWVRKPTGETTERFYGVCWSPELGIFCAVSNLANASTNKVLISNGNFFPGITNEIIQCTQGANSTLSIYGNNVIIGENSAEVNVGEAGSMPICVGAPIYLEENVYSKRFRSFNVLNSATPTVSGANGFFMSVSSVNFYGGSMVNFEINMAGYKSVGSFPGLLTWKFEGFCGELYPTTLNLFQSSFYVNTFAHTYCNGVVLWVPPTCTVDRWKVSVGSDNVNSSEYCTINITEYPFYEFYSANT